MPKKPSWIFTAMVIILRSGGATTKKQALPGGIGMIDPRVNGRAAVSRLAGLPDIRVLTAWFCFSEFLSFQLTMKRRIVAPQPFPLDGG